MILIILLSSISVTIGQEYSFCSGDNLYSFTGQLCPGGVLLKESIKIDEPCFCFGADLNIYEDCNTDGVLKTGTFPGCQAPLIQSSDNWSGEAKFFLPMDNFTQKATGEFEFCPKIRDTCIRLDQGNITDINDHLMRLNEISNDNIDQQRLIRQQKDKACSIWDKDYCEDDKTPIIFDIVQMLAYVQSFDRLLIVSNTFELLKLSVEIFKALSPEWMIPDSTMDNIFAVFNFKYSMLDLIGADKYLREDTFMELRNQLEKCLTDTKELVFMKDESTCPPKVGKLIHINEEEGQSEALDTDMPADRMYKKDEEDLVIGVLWKTVDAVHKQCLLYNHYYFTNMENLFLMPLVQARHYDRSGYGTLLYSGIVDHDDLQVFMENVDKIDAAVHATSKHKTFFKKPIRYMSEMISPQDPDPDPSDSGARREKRSADTDSEYIEIWGGRAYCFLQKKNFTTPTDDPDLKKMCEETKMLKTVHCIPFPIQGEALKNVSTNCPQIGEGSEKKAGVFRLKNNIVESCCYDPMNCTDTEQSKCIEKCQQFCDAMKSQYLSSDDLLCKCTHSQEFVKLTQS